MPAIPRPTVRVVLLDDADRLLLFRSDSPRRWYLPGGGLRPDETYETAAQRELFEETGLAEVEIGPEVWRGRPWVADWEGVSYQVHQRYHLARLPAFDISTSRFEAFERSQITGHKWWTLRELTLTPDLLRPANLPALITDLLHQGPPEIPTSVDG
ncbi:NUDIX domain-containing protein [Kribbella sp. NBC_01245]|uniref:NUDIX domain-containing protein n=1 Tax=Kribbella sp. NBC_01245 TaxID=2903578 RepID=UPI002E2E18FA|nr:NUDIX domain-containing protein [Kribbella sp. NBC_01245]